MRDLIREAAEIQRMFENESMSDDDQERIDDSRANATRDTWERIADWWDQSIGEGNEFQLALIMPATDRLLNIQPGEVVLDVACGNGNYARRLGRSGAKVVAFDGAATFIQRAGTRTKNGDGDIEYLVLDATNEPGLNSLGESRFDAAVCSMAIMDFPTIDPLLRALRRLLKPGGRFVFSVPHPCFNSQASNKMTAELVEDDGRLSQVFGVHVSSYLEPTANLSCGIINQPEPHYLFHRPMHMLLGSCFAAGFVVDGMEEPAFAPGTSAKSAFSWAKRPRIPPAMVIRVRK